MFPQETMKQMHLMLKLMEEFRIRQVFLLKEYGDSVLLLASIIFLSLFVMATCLLGIA